MKNHFKIIIPSFNSVQYLPRTLQSVESQTYRDFNVCIIDDGSTLAQQKEIIQDFCQRNGWQAIYHEHNQGALASIIDAIHHLNCQDSDIIVLLDGDDWLYDEYVLDKLNQVYNQNDVYLTWGQFETFPPHCIQMNYALPITKEVIEQKLYREIVDVFNHLRTFKYRLFREIQDEDLRDPETNEYFRVSGDKALMYPMLEMAGHKVSFIKDILYVYNIDNPLNDFKINAEQQAKVSEYLRRKAHYPILSLEKSKIDLPDDVLCNDAD